MLLTLLKEQNRSALQWVQSMEDEDKWLDGVALLTYRHMFKVYKVI
jgi:hypothetical protein